MVINRQNFFKSDFNTVQGGISRHPPFFPISTVLHVIFSKQDIHIYARYFIIIQQ